MSIIPHYQIFDAAPCDKLHANRKVSKGRRRRKRKVNQSLAAYNAYVIQNMTGPSLIQPDIASTIYQEIQDNDYIQDISFLDPNYEFSQIINIFCKKMPTFMKTYIVYTNNDQSILFNIKYKEFLVKEPWFNQLQDDIGHRLKITCIWHTATRCSNSKCRYTKIYL